MRSSRTLMCVVTVVLMCGIAMAQLPGKVRLPAKKPTGTSQQADVNVQRNPGGTPEVTSVTPKEAVSGKVVEVTVATQNATLSPLEVKSSGECQRISNVRASGPQEVKFNLDLTNVHSSMYCYGQLMAGRRYLSWNVHVLSAEDAQRKQQQEAFEKQYKDRATAMTKMAASQMGKLWSVEFANGEKDTWTLVANEQDGSGTFKNSAGKPVKIMVMPDAGLVVVDLGAQCALQGQLQGAQVSGMVISPKCKWQSMSQWKAKIS